MKNTCSGFYQPKNLIIKTFLMYMNRFTVHPSKILGTLTLLFCLGMTSTAPAQTHQSAPDSVNQTFDLEQAIKTALANNTQIKRSLLSVQNADQEVRKAWSNVMPEISASMNYTRNIEKPVFFFPQNPADPNSPITKITIGEDNDWQGGLSVSQTLFSGQAFVGISSSELFKAAQAEGMRATAQGIVTQTRITYYQALVAKERLRLVEAQMDRLRKALEDAKKLNEQGFTDDYAVLQLEVQLSNLEPQLTQARYNVKEALQELLDVMGLPVQIPLDIKGDLSAFDIQAQQTQDEANLSIKKIDKKTPFFFDKDTSALEQALDLRGDVRSLDIQRKLRGKQLDAQKSAYLPIVFAQYGLNWNAQQAGTPNFFGSEENRARFQTLTVGVQLPIFQGFSRNASLQQAQIQIKDAELQLAQTKRTANKEIFTAEQNVREALETSQALKKALNQAERGYERAQIRFQNGVGSQQELNDAELQLRQAEINYAQMVSGYLSAKAQYDQAIGQVPFVEEDVQEIKENIELK